jgi:ABC-2 type transport system permease protein/sodium transport system permease protein
MLVSLAPGLASLLPGLQLGGLLTVAPLLNIVLLARDLMGGTASLGSAAVVVFSTLLYAATAVAAAARIFGAEDVLYSEQTAWSDLLRRPAESRAAPTVAGALLCLGLMYPTYFVLQGVFGLLLTGTWGRAAQILSTLLVAGLSVLLFGVFPLTAALLRRVRLRSGFLLGLGSWPAYAAALLLGLSLWPFVLELLALIHGQGWTTLDTEKSEKVLGPLLRMRRSLPLWLTVGSVVIQAVFEELFFRGYLFSALRAAGGARTTILTSAVLFGLFHVLATPLFALDRLLPSTLLGVVLGWVCWQGRSVLPAMLLHACHNTVLEVFNYYQRAASGPRGGGVPGTVPAAWLLPAAVGVAAGVALLAWGRWRRRPLAVATAEGPVATAEMGHG